MTFRCPAGSRGTATSTAPRWSRTIPAVSACSRRSRRRTRTAA
jgi:hypothetical protein